MPFHQPSMTKKRERFNIRPPFHYRSQPYRQWIASRPCYFANFPGHRCYGRTVCAHMRLDTDGWAQEKPSDWWTWPLCDDGCDTAGQGAHNIQHRKGEKEFFRLMGIKEPLQIPAFYWWHFKNAHRVKYERDPSMCQATPPPRPGTINAPARLMPALPGRRE